jgi:DNA mismatch repair protein MSH3
MGADERVKVGFIAVTPSTGDVVWDEFDGTTCSQRCFVVIKMLITNLTDGHMRTELEVSTNIVLPKRYVERHI